MERGWLGRLAALLALLGFIFAASASPPVPSLDPQRGAVLCHGGSDPLSFPGEDEPERDQCCLLCQAAQVAKGAVAPVDLPVPAPSASVHRFPATIQTAAMAVAARHAQARAPPMA